MTIIEMIDRLDDILMVYADESNYHQTTRRCEFVTNNVDEETFYEFDGDAKLANEGLCIIEKIRKTLRDEDKTQKGIRGMKINTKITISKNSNDEIHIRIKDSVSNVEFVDVEMSLADFAAAITGLAMVNAVADVRGLEYVGKQKVIEKRTAIAPRMGYDRNDMKRWLNKNCQEDGWIIDDYLGPQGSITSVDEGTLLRYWVYKYVETEHLKGDGQ
jgi:hypothetical protein